MSSSLSSRLQCLVIAQNPPLDSEIYAARRVLLDDRKELAELKAQIADLVSRQKQLEEHLAHHERIVFSINRFPPEILSLIFLFTLPSHEDILGEDIPWLAGPWLVSQVCSRWRDVALSFPSLWASPFISEGVRQTPRRLDLQLLRSANASLHPRLVGSPRSMVLASKLLAALITRSDRWSSLLLAFNWISLQPQMALFLKRRVSQLETLDIHGSWSGAIAALPEGQRLDAFSIAPRLRRLSVIDVCEPAVSLVLPWHQLTHYCAVNGGHEHLAVLRLCPSLISAHLTFRTALTVVDNAPIELQLPQLCKLHVVNSHFLRIMSTPMLQDIVLERITPEDDALVPLLAIVCREKPPLRSISLFHSLVTPTLLYILEETPSVETLRIHIHRGDSSMVDALITRLTTSLAHTKCFAPKLAMLELSGRGAFDEERLLDMVQSRRQASPRADCACQRIRTLSLRMTQKAALSAPTVQRLHALAQEGLYLSITPFSFFSDELVDPY